MKVQMGFNGSMIVDDMEGIRHLFSPEEVKQIGTAYYRWVQKRRKVIIE